MRYRFESTQAGILAAATLILNIIVISFGFTTHPVWFGVLVFTGPLLWFALGEAARDRSEER